MYLFYTKEGECKTFKHRFRFCLLRTFYKLDIYKKNLEFLDFSPKLQLLAQQAHPQLIPDYNKSIIMNLIELNFTFTCWRTHPDCH